MRRIPMKYLKVSRAPAAMALLLWLSAIPGVSAYGAASLFTPETVLEYSLEQVKQVESDFPKDPQIHFIKGFIYYRAKQYERSIHEFTEGLKLSPDIPEIVDAIAYNYFLLTDYEQAIEWYQKSVAAGKPFERSYQRMGQSYEKLNKRKEAIAAYENEIEFYPDNAPARVYLGECYFSDDRLEAAKAQAETVIELKPIYPEPYYLLSKIYRKQGDQKSAEEMLKIFQEKKKEETVYLEDQEAPLSDREKAVQSAILTHVDIATVYQQRNRLEKAGYHLNRVLTIDPKNERARFELAKMYEERGELAKAAAITRELIALNPSDYRYHLGLGAIYAKQRQMNDAKSHLEIAIALAPDEPEAKRLLARIQLVHFKQSQAAIQLLEDIVNHNPKAEDYDLLSWAYFSNQNIDKSLDAMQRAIALDPTNKTYQERYNKILSRMK